MQGPGQGQGTKNQSYKSKNELGAGGSSSLTSAHSTCKERGLSDGVKGTRRFGWVKGLGTGSCPSLPPSLSLQLLHPVPFVSFSPNSSILFQAWLYSPQVSDLPVSHKATEAL